MHLILVNPLNIRTATQLPPCGALCHDDHVNSEDWDIMRAESGLLSVMLFGIDDGTGNDSNTLPFLNHNEHVMYSAPLDKALQRFLSKSSRVRDLIRPRLRMYIDMVPKILNAINRNHIYLVADSEEREFFQSILSDAIMALDGYQSDRFDREGGLKRLIKPAMWSIRPKIDVIPSAFFTAVYWGDIQRCEAILSLCPSAIFGSRRLEDTNPINIAVRMNNCEMVEWLIDVGFDINRPAEQGETALMIAATSGNKDQVAFLINKGAKLDSTNILEETPLMLAAYYGHKDVCELLVQAGADINFVGEDDRSALRYAIQQSAHPYDNQQSFKEIVELLMRAGATPWYPPVRRPIP